MYSVSEIQRILHAEALSLQLPQHIIQQCSIDSRSLTDKGSALFFALKGEKRDGHAFIKDAYNAGVRHFVVSQRINTQDYPDSNILLVHDTLAALQALSTFHRNKFKLPVIGIAGSNGKTIVKEWLFQMLHKDFNIVRSPKSFNSQIGVPLSVLQLNHQHQLAIFEAGISKPHEMTKLEAIIRPNIGIFTFLGAAHNEGFASIEQKIAEKMLFFAHCDTILYCCDHTTVHEAIHNWRNTLPHRKAIGWSIAGHPDAALQINITPDANAKGCHADATWKAPTPHAQDMHFKFMLPFSDAASITNALHCVCQLLHMGYTGIAIKKSLKRISTVTMRLELKSGINNCIVINDSYNNDLHALRLAMDYATTQAGSNRTKTLLLSDVLQSGETDQQIYKKIAQWLTESQFTRLIAVGIAIKHIEQYLPKGFQYAYYPTTHLLLERFNQLDFHNECILIKGARAFQLERIAQRLQQKLHKTVLEVNLSALTHNLKTYLQLLRPETSLLVMVKASAYGSGSVQVAKVLEQNNVQYLGVAYADEGVELRQAGIKLPILVLNPEVGAFESMLRHQLEPEIYSLSLLHELVAYTGKHKKLSIHLKLDTGMHRLGFISEHLDELCGILEKHPNLQVKSIFSHLSSSGNPQFDAFTHQQAHTFTQLAQRISDRLANQPMRHIANTGGIVRFPEYHFEMVRLGIGLYGADGGSLQPQLQVVNTLKATISQIKTVHAGETVGYNRMGQIQKETKIATISIGYADGLLRAAGNGRYSVLLHQTLAPIVGNVCMDMTMIDVSHIPQAREGDEVIIFGTHPTVEDLAKALQTIPYEVFTNISERVKKVYWSE